MVDGELVPQGEDFQLEGNPSSEGSAKGGEEGNEDGHHGREQRLPQPHPLASCAGRMLEWLLISVD